LLNFPRKTGKKEDSKNCCVRSAKLVAAIDVWDSLEQNVIDELSINAVLDFVPVSARKGDISNSLCNLHLNFIIN